MALQTTDFCLIRKTQLTHDVFELVFSGPVWDVPKAGQYIIFVLLQTKLRRSYSLASYQNGEYTCIIKRLEDGQGGSKEICDLPLESCVPTIGPIGHFTLSEGDKTRAYIGTGTGFAPVYFQARSSVERGDRSKQIFVYGVRSEQDQFYLDQIAHLSEVSSQFSSCFYLSRPKIVGSSVHTGYVTDWITGENISGIEEFYLCGSPAMVKDARARLEELGVPKECVKFEQF
ncbi:MAG: FAD-dependent oxidoreductase [Candidatus Gracilibacteria bacterium]